MSALDQIAYSLGKRDEVPNRLLAQQLAAKHDHAGLQEIADHLWDKNVNIQNDCIKVLYEVGMINPDLIGMYAGDFLKLIQSRNNRLVWGAMIALSTFADKQADALFPHIDTIMKVTRSGSVITKDGGIKTLGLIGSVKPEYHKAVFSFLLDHLKTCRPKEVPQHAESTLPAVDVENRQESISVLNKRMEDLTPTGLTRIKKVIKAAEKLSD
jgi:hypothetical protein